MAELPQPQFSTVTQIYKAYEAAERGEWREHLGASIIGRECERQIWYSWRWTLKVSFSGRMLRLFQRGQLEEDQFIKDLRAIGAEVHAVNMDTGDQFRVSALGGHFGGSMDGAARGIPEAPKSWHVLEFKTHNDKSFTKLAKESVAKAKPEHYTQMQVYMGLTGMERALYLGVNKNDDNLYGERVRFDSKHFQRTMEKAERIVRAPEPPPRISNDAAFFKCKFCDASSLCHGTSSPYPNCRTCLHATPIIEGEGHGVWGCGLHQCELSRADQVAGCIHHRFIPPLLEKFAEPLDAGPKGEWVQYRNKLTNETFVNANEPGHPQAFTSQEIFACEDKRILGDAGVGKFKEVFGAEVVMEGEPARVEGGEDA